MTTSGSAPSRAGVLVVLGIALVCTGIYSLAGAFYSSLARYMHVEDAAPWLSGEQLHTLTQLTAADKGLIVLSAFLALAGLAAICAAAVRRRRTGPAGA